MDYLKRIQKNWNDLARMDPLWAISSLDGKKGNKWNAEAFFQRGIDEIDGIINHIKHRDLEIRYEKALDFGCGVGRLTQALAKYFNNVVGVDIAPSMVELAINYNKFGSRVRYSLNDSDNLSIFNDKSFDFIYTADVLQHLSPYYSGIYIKEFIRILSLSGLLVFQIPSENSNKIRNLMYKLGLTNLISNIYHTVKGEPHVDYHYIKREIIENIIQRNGGKIVEIREDIRCHGVISETYFIIRA